MKYFYMNQDTEVFLIFEIIRNVLVSYFNSFSTQTNYKGIYSHYTDFTVSVRGLTLKSDVYSVELIPTLYEKYIYHKLNYLIN